MKLTKIILENEEIKNQIIFMELIYDMLIGEEFNLKPTKNLKIRNLENYIKIVHKPNSYKFEIVFPATEIEMDAFCYIEKLSNNFSFDLILTEDISFYFTRSLTENTSERMISDLKAFFLSVEERLDKYFGNIS